MNGDINTASPMRSAPLHATASAPARLSILALAAAGVLALSPAALAQEDFSVDWHTVDCGGGSSNGEEFVIVATIAQPDAGNMYGGESGESFEISGGFWAVISPSCYANCDGSTGTPMLTANDFQCFLNLFASNNPAANCDGSTGTPALTPNDFQCFVDRFATGCL